MRSVDVSSDCGRTSLWLVDSASAVPLTLTPAEHARMDRFETAPLRERFARARSTLRLLLARRLGLAPLEVPLALSPAGKPMVETCAADGQPVSVSVSHCGDDSIVALSTTPEVGVDMACRDARIDTGLVARWLDTRCARVLAAIAPPQRRIAFHAWWTAIEAVGKADGGGLPAILPEASALFHPDPPARHTVRALGRMWTLSRLRFARLPEQREVTVAMAELETRALWQRYQAQSHIRFLA